MIRSIKKFRLHLVFIFSGILFLDAASQNPSQFHQEVQHLIAADTAVIKENLIMFTGSSSVRFWKTLRADFPTYNIVNHGFGGSTMTDLFYYLDTLVIPFQPKKVFIYEGDNDINAGKEPDDVLADAIKLTRSIKDRLPDTQVLFISPKPSLSRWNLKSKYESYNEKLKSWTVTQKGVVFIDVWSPMLDVNGVVRNDLFIEDGLHMNRTGYSIWTKVIEVFVKN